MALAPGARLGAYEVIALLGEGGMGKVWRAHHIGLKRDDALKVLPDDVAADAERVARFQREAQVLASLNHPNIAQVFGLEEADGIKVLVMELVEGPTLAARIARGAISTDEAIPIARQIAEALEAAHEQGIVHRDLKPANIKIRPDGMVKVLDFGLAKALEPKSTNSLDATASPTVTTPAMTQMGVILGTAAYMSPEQARGRTVDRRADIWAFGCVLFEMLTGHRAFGGEDVTDTLAAVLRSGPRWETLPTAISPSLHVFLRRCLHKDSKQRVGDIRDVRLALEGAFEPSAAETVIADPKFRFWHRPSAAATVLLSLMASTGLAVWTLMRPAPAAPVRMTVALPPGETVSSGGDPDLAISPDGRHIVFVAGDSTPHLYVRAVDQLDARRLSGAESPRAPFMSPDGNWVGFFDAPATLKKVSVNGGPPVAISTLQGAPGATGGGPRGGSWSPDNTIVFATNDPTTGLLRVSAGGGEPQILTKPDPQKGEADHFWPEVLPGGDAVLFTIVRAGGSPFNTGRLIENAQIAVLDLRTGEQRVLIQGGSDPHYVTSGHIVYGVGGTLRAVAFDIARLEVRSDPFPVLEGVETTVTGAASFAVSQNGSLIYVRGGAPGISESARTLVWVDREGHEETISAPPRAYLYPRISPDGTRVALDVRDQENDIWVWEFDRKTLTRLTFDPELDSFPAWTPDGKRIAFSANRAGRGSISWEVADGTGAVELLTESSRNQQTGFVATSQAPGSFSPDGTRLVFREISPKTGYDILVMTLETPHRTSPLVQTTFTEYNPEVSPDGRWVAFESNESGQFEVYVRPFPDVVSGRWQVSTGGGRQPLWARNGRELFYLSVASAGRIMAVPIQPGPGFSAGDPKMIIDGPYAGVPGRGVVALSGRTYDVSRDGQRFLMIKGSASTEAAAPMQIIVVQNWLEELKHLVPTK
jgi:serine/threonine-protein kinase